jgi:hypothetical protein
MKNIFLIMLICVFMIFGCEEYKHRVVKPGEGIILGKDGSVNPGCLSNCQ